jgi:hypothetical protein
VTEFDELRAIPAARRRLDEQELDLIDRARRSGATWADIADALGLTSRQAAEQRRVRLSAAVRPPRHDLDKGYGESLVTLRAAAVDLHRRIGADRRWDKRFGRAALVRETLAAAPDAVAGSLFSLVLAAVGDLPPDLVLPAPTSAAVDRLRDAVRAAQPHA